jgi:hypothetical protein
MSYQAVGSHAGKYGANLLRQLFRLQDNVLPCTSVPVQNKYFNYVFENRVLRRIFGPKRDGLTGEWRKLHNEELNDLYSSSNIVRVIKWRRMRWAGHVAHMEGLVMWHVWRKV